MKSQAIAGLFMSLISTQFFGFSSPIQAEEYIAGTYQRTTFNLEIQAGEQFVVKLSNDITIKYEDADNYPVLLSLESPINIPAQGIIPANGSFLNAYLKTTDSGVLIVTESIVINGQSIPFYATSSIYPTILEGSSGNEQKDMVTGILLGERVIGDVLVATGMEYNDAAEISQAGGILGGLIALAQSSEKDEFVALRGEVPLILTVQN